MMLRHNKLPLDITKNANQKYLSKRKDVIKVIKQTNNKLHFHSQTFYYALYCLDMIFCKDISMQKLSDFVLVGLSCLSISAKINENDPNVPEMKKFISVLSNISRFRYRYSIDELIQSELWCMKMLHYKITYYSIYNFLVFFFAHGVFLNNFSISKNDNDLVIFKVLEKIYVVSRELLDMVLEEESLILGEDCSIAAAIILRKAIESVFVNIKINDVFSTLYLIDDKKEKYLRISKIVNSLLQNKKKKKENNVTSPSTSSSTNEGETEFNKPVMKDSMMDLALVNLANGNSSSNIQGELHNVKLGDIEKENEKEQPLKIVEQK
jgi:hypothetical protein